MGFGYSSGTTQCNTVPWLACFATPLRVLPLSCILVSEIMLLSVSEPNNLKEKSHSMGGVNGTVMSRDFGKFVSSSLRFCSHCAFVRLELDTSYVNDTLVAMTWAKCALVECIPFGSCVLSLHWLYHFTHNGHSTVGAPWQMMAALWIKFEELTWIWH